MTNPTTFSIHKLSINLNDGRNDIHKPSCSEPASVCIPCISLMVGLRSVLMQKFFSWNGVFWSTLWRLWSTSINEFVRRLADTWTDILADVHGDHNTRSIREALITSSAAAGFGRHGMPPPASNPDLWPFDLETDVRVASKVRNRPSKFGYAKPFGSRIIRYVRDGQTDGRTKATLIAPFPTVGGIITADKLRCNGLACSQSWSSWRRRLSCESSCSLCSSRTRILASRRPLCWRRRRASASRSTSPFACTMSAVVVSAAAAESSSHLASFCSPSARRSSSYSSWSALQQHHTHSVARF